MEYRNMYSVLGLNYEQKFCLVCNTPYFSNTSASAAHSSQSQQQHHSSSLDNANSLSKQTFCKVFQVEDISSSPASTNLIGSNHASSSTSTNSAHQIGMDLINNRRSHHHNSHSNQLQQNQHHSSVSHSGHSSSSNSNQINLFCHTCSLKIQNLSQLLIQLEMIQSQISTLRDELGYCLVNAFPTTNLNDPNYTLKLKVFQKWSFKYMPQNSNRSSINSLSSAISHSTTTVQQPSQLLQQSHQSQQQQQHLSHSLQLHGIPVSQQPPPAHSALQQQLLHPSGTTGTDRFSEIINLNVNIPIPTPMLFNDTSHHSSVGGNSRSSSVGTSGTPAPPIVEDNNLQDERNSVASSSLDQQIENDDSISRGGDSQDGLLVNYSDAQLQQDLTPTGTTGSRKRKKSDDNGNRKDANGVEQCFICGKMLTNDYLRKNHMQTHSDLKPYKCSMCDKSFANINYKKMHEKTHDKSRLQGEPKFDCPKCGRKYHLQKGLYKHMRYSPTCGTTTLVDHGKVRCQCELCGREFNSRYRLGVHVRGFHKKLRPVSCTICGRPCVDNQQRKKHELTHNPNPSKRFMLKCPQCPEDNEQEYERKRDLEKHYLVEHPDCKIPNIRRPTRHPRKFVCSLCPESADATFTEKRALEYHMERFHNPNGYEEGSEDIKYPKIKGKKKKKSSTLGKRSTRTGSTRTKKSTNKGKVKSRVLREPLSDDDDSNNSSMDSDIKIPPPTQRKRAPPPKRQSRRISEKYRNIRNLRYLDGYCSSEEDEFKADDNGGGTDEEDERRAHEEAAEQDDQKDDLLIHGEIESNSNNNNNHDHHHHISESLAQVPENYLEVKLEPEDFQ